MTNDARRPCKTCDDTGLIKVPQSCPDGIVGCAVVHFRREACPDCTAHPQADAPALATTIANVIRHKGAGFDECRSCGFVVANEAPLEHYSSCPVPDIEHALAAPREPSELRKALHDARGLLYIHCGKDHPIIERITNALMSSPSSEDGPSAEDDAHPSGALLDAWMLFNKERGCTHYNTGENSNEWEAFVAAINFRLAAAPAPLASAVAAETWRKIETAPHNQKIIGGYWNALGKWREVMACYYSTGTLECENDDIADENGYAPEGWYEESETHEEILPVDQPLVYWRPLLGDPNCLPSDTLKRQEAERVRVARWLHNQFSARLYNWEINMPEGEKEYWLAKADALFRLTPAGDTPASDGETQ